MKLHPPQRHHNQPPNHFELCVQLHEPPFPPSSSSALLNLAHALRTGAKESGFVRKHAFLLQIFGKTQLVFLMLLPSLNIPCKLSPIVQQSPPTHPTMVSSVISCQSPTYLSKCLKSGYLAYTFSGLQSHHYEGSARNCRQSVLVATAPAAPAVTVGATFLPQVVATALLPASHKVYVLNGATFSQVRVDCALP